MGIVEWGRQNYREALEHYRSAFEIFQNLGDIVHAGLISNSLGVTLHKLGRLKQAASMLQGALDMHRASGQRLLEGHALAALGDIFFDEMSLDLASEHYRASLEIRREIGDRKGEGWLSHHLARLLFLQADEQKGQARLTEALAIASDTGDQQLAEACASLNRRENNAALHN
jgi:tetratricopeptide (TPR) repeat protein